jgi:hypothetical protein
MECTRDKSTSGQYLECGLECLSTAGNNAKSLCVSFEGDTTPPYGELKKREEQVAA